MDFWVWFWGSIFTVTLVLYAGLVLVIAVGGWKDIRAMFRNLDQQHTGSQVTDRQTN